VTQNSEQFCFEIQNRNSCPAEGSSVKIFIASIRKDCCNSIAGHWGENKRNNQIDVRAVKDADESRIGRRTRAQHVQANGMQNEVKSTL
jgi:hypothetical protein